MRRNNKHQNYNNKSMILARRIEQKIEYYFPSKSEVGRYHTLMELNSGWNCDCLAKPFNPDIKECRHIQILKWYLENHPQMILESKI